MPRYFCWVCQDIWSSGGHDFKVVPALCPEHKAEKHVVLPVETHVPKLSLVMFKNQPYNPPRTGMFGQ